MSEMILPSRIESVLVFRRDAEVCRVARLEEVAARPERVVLQGLPLCLEDDAMRVSVRAANGRAPVPLALTVTLGTAEPDAELPPPVDEELRAARRRVGELRQRREQVEGQRDALQDLPSVERPRGRKGEPPPPSPAGARGALLRWRLRRLADLDERLTRVEREHLDATDRLEELERRRRSSARQARTHELRKGAVVSLGWPDEGVEGPVELELRYQVPGARWAPAYTVTFDRDMTRAELAMRAVVAQRTGEDWRDVRLMLSTADAQRWIDLPELKAIRIGRRQPSVSRRGWCPPPTGADELYGDLDAFRGRRAVPPPPPDEPGPPDEVAGEHLAASVDAVVAQAGSMESFPEEEVGANPAAPPPAPRMKRRAKVAAAPARSSPGGGAARAASDGGEGYGRDEAPAAAATEGDVGVDATREQLAYDVLRMLPPGSARRGRLVRMDHVERTMELARRARLEDAAEAVDAVRRAWAGAHRVREMALPRGHTDPEAWEGFDAIVRADTGVDVVSDGRFHAVPLLARTASAETRHVVVPRESSDVFHVATLRNPLEKPLLPGPAEVHAGGDFLLTTPLAATPPGGELRVGLGVDQAVRISRNTEFSEKTRGLISGTRALAHAIRIEIANRRGTDIDIEVRERIPVARDGDDDIEIGAVSAEPPWEPWEPDDAELRGGHRWRLGVEAGGVRELVARYTVTISARHELVGGNRREV